MDNEKIEKYLSDKSKEYEKFVSTILERLGAERPFLKGTKLTIEYFKNKKDPEGVDMTEEEALYKVSVVVPTPFHIKKSKITIKGQGGRLEDAIKDLTGNVDEAGEHDPELFPKRDDDGQLDMFDNDADSDDNNVDGFTKVS